MSQRVRSLALISLKREALAIPAHNRDVKLDLLFAIIKAVGLSRQEFRRLL